MEAGSTVTPHRGHVGSAARCARKGVWSAGKWQFGHCEQSAVVMWRPVTMQNGMVFLHVSHESSVARRGVPSNGQGVCVRTSRPGGRVGGRRGSRCAACAVSAHQVLLDLLFLVRPADERLDLAPELLLNEVSVLGAHENARVVVGRALHAGALALDDRRREDGHDMHGELRDILGDADHHARGGLVVVHLPREEEGGKGKARAFLSKLTPRGGGGGRTLTSFFTSR